MVRAVRLSGDASLSAETSHSLPMFICTIDYFILFFLFNVVTLQSFPFVAGSRRLYAVCTSIACWRVFN